METMDRLTNEITARIKAYLPEWYGPEAHLIDEPRLQLRNWSLFIRYEIQVNALVEKVILVKIRRRPEMQVEEAINDVALKKEGKGDFEALRAMEKYFEDDQDEAHYCAVVALAFFDEYSALVMEELDAPPLRHRIIDPRMAFHPAWQQTVETLLLRTGRWLCVHHEKLGELQEQPFYAERIFLGLQDFIKTLEAANPKQDFSAVHKVVNHLQEKHKNTRLPYGLLHWNFNFTNILVTHDDRLGVLDPHFIAGPVYVDLTKVMTDLETYSMQVLTYGLYIRPKTMKRLQNALLRGYFGDKPHNQEILDFFCLYSILEKWQRDEEAVTRYGKGWKLVRQGIQSLIVWRRSYFMKLVEKYLQKLEPAT